MITVFLGADRMKDFDIIFEQLSINWTNTIAYTNDKKKNIIREYETHYESRILYLTKIMYSADGVKHSACLIHIISVYYIIFAEQD